MSPRLRFAIETARLAGDSTLGLFRTGGEFELKGDQTPVTEADKGAEQIVRGRIQEHYPGEHILGEEEGGDSGTQDRWVVDPIDGTKSFVAGVPLYATLLSYEVGQEPVLGVAYFPALGELVYAEVGAGTFWNDEPCRVKDNSELAHAVVCCGGHKSLLKAGRWDGLAKLAESCLATRTWSDAYGHCLVATGRADAMIDPVVSRWDVSAIKVIVEEAGGSFTDFQGRPGLTDEAVSCQPMLRDLVLGAFA